MTLTQHQYTGDSVTDAVINSLIYRQAVGQKEYGTTLGANDTRPNPIDWLKDVQEELLDAVQYIEKTIQDNDLLFDKICVILGNTINPDDADTIYDELWNLFHSTDE